MADDDELIKIIVIGDSQVGKTSFIHRYVNNTFKNEYKSTIGVDFSLKVLRWADNRTIKLQLWDIAGQERFTFMTRAYYKDAKGCLLIFDVTNLRSFEQVVKWKQDLDSKARLPDGSMLPCLLVANKSDLTERAMAQSDIVDLCRNLQFIGWMETSVKEGHMITEAMDCLIGVVKRKGENNGKPAFNESICLTNYDEPSKWYSSCKC